MSGEGLSKTYVEEVMEGLPGHAVQGRACFRDQWALDVRSEDLLEVMAELRDRWGFRYLIDVTAVDFYPQKPRFQVVYHLWCHAHQALLRVKTWVETDTPSVPSVTGLWTTADWHERECYDLFGIHFTGHPNLRRILLPEAWEGHPLRKDYPTEGPDWDLD
ncbi:MAG: NADH-quinone oxidoreductase subunit C [Desulfosoma sp.]|uniref:NADH-quinone oxidoreductase subunit C n=1 Tax=Desulfosoma sp. TaxID=2603217 RepID=UPI00404940FA